MPKRIDVPGFGIVEFPDEMSDAQIVSAIKENAKQTLPQETKTFSPLEQPLRDFGLGALRGAGAIGATLLSPIDAAAKALGIQNSLIGRTDRRQAMTDATQMLGADPESLPYVGGKLAAEMAGTAGVGGTLGRAVGTIAPRVGQAMAAGGFANVPLPINMAGGAATGIAGASLIDPTSQSAAFGGAAGAAFPVVGAALSPAANWASRTLMQSAIKPTIKQLKSGDAKVAIDTMLQEGISPTKSGVTKLRSLIDDKNQEIANAIQGSTATVNKFSALRPLSDTAQKFSNQVNPTSDLETITKAGLEFLQHPSYPGPTMPVQDAQSLKQGTYRILSKKYGQVGTADTEAQKAIARGLKNEIASAVPAVEGLNSQEGNLLRTLDVAERRALMELNKNPMGLSLLASHPATWAAFMADRSAAFKALAARMVYSTNQMAGKSAPTMGQSMGLLGATYGSTD